MKHWIGLTLAIVCSGCCGGRSEPHGEPIGSSLGNAPQARTVPSAAASPSVTAQPSASASAVPVGNVRLRERDEAAIGEKLTLADALAEVRPKILDATEEWDRGTFLLGLWLSEHGKWATVDSLPSTNHAKVSKDSDGEVGKKICETGTVTVIKAMKTDGPKMFWGIISSSETRALVFMAAGDTGNIVDNSQARFCGVATGIFHLTLKSGGPLPSPKAVGFFDLPANRKR